MKRCSRCQIEKSPDEFSRDKSTPDGLCYRCRTCNYEAFKAWAAKNKDALREKSKQRARANPEANRARVKQWREDNPDKARESHRRNKAKRREREQAAGMGPRRVSRVKAWEDQGGVCPCGEPIDRSLKYPDPMSPSLDHITPLARGGLHTQDNIQWMHHRCNVLKGVSV